MTQKMSLLDAAPIPDGDRQERALIHAYHESWQLYTRACDLRPVSNISETWRIDYVRVRDKDEDAERKNDLWQILRYSAGFHQLISTKSEQPIPLPYWNLIFWKDLPVFNYTIDGHDYAYMTAIENLMVEKPAVALAQPIPEAEVLKIETKWPFENLERAFGEMVQQKLVETGAELLVPKRFVEFGKVKPLNAFFRYNSAGPCLQLPLLFYYPWSRKQFCLNRVCLLETLQVLLFPGPRPLGCSKSHMLGVSGGLEGAA